MSTAYSTCMSTLFKTKRHVETVIRLRTVDSAHTNAIFALPGPSPSSFPSFIFKHAEIEPPLLIVVRETTFPSHFIGVGKSHSPISMSPLPREVIYICDLNFRTLLTSPYLTIPSSGLVELGLENVRINLCCFLLGLPVPTRSDSRDRHEKDRGLRGVRRPCRPRSGRRRSSYGAVPDRQGNRNLRQKSGWGDLATSNNALVTSSFLLL